MLGHLPEPTDSDSNAGIGTQTHLPPKPVVLLPGHTPPDTAVFHSDQITHYRT